jgi:hypothetical protein
MGVALAVVLLVEGLVAVEVLAALRLRRGRGREW